MQVMGNSQPLVLLHGWGWHSGIWQPLLPYLAEKFQLFLIDLPGFGKSPLGNFRYQEAEIADLLLAHVPEKAHWLGWSLGGMIAWNIALHHPERVNSLITVASSPKFLHADNWPGVDTLVLKNFSDLLLQDQHKTLHDFLELQLRGSANKHELLPELKQIFSNTKFSPDALQMSLQLLQKMDLRAQLNKLSVPSLHLFGSHDTLVPTDVAALIAPQLQSGKCEVIKRSGHLPFLSQQEKFLELIFNFILNN